MTLFCECVYVFYVCLAWLEEVGLPQYKHSFMDARVDGHVLNVLTLVSQFAACLIARDLFVFVVKLWTSLFYMIVTIACHILERY